MMLSLYTLMPFSSKPLPLFLVIEDNEDYCSLLEWSYQKQAPACRLYFVRSAEEALRYLEDCFIKPQLILLDYDLPGMDGLDFLEHLRHSSVWKICLSFYSLLVKIVSFKRKLMAKELPALSLNLVVTWLFKPFGSNY
ncbi:hypothetical protein BWI97_25485 [Siphonobacter sp. BAB-5405]|uniref:response regulator n=1 Tax=Siphonobacter sp. BAB-5405 TaxID=1864825 RepID=UPI000C7FD3CA|nr:hypothetical protein BWI97_25485 [Siphonobacter sp. BAB-5405]